MRGNEGKLGGRKRKGVKEEGKRRRGVRGSEGRKELNGLPDNYVYKGKVLSCPL